MKKITLLSLLIIFCASCGTTDFEAVYQRSRSEMPSSVGKPDWVDIHKDSIDEGDRIAFIGSSIPKKTEKEAVDDATETAFNKISRFFGVSVSAVFYHRDVKINGKYTEDISTDESIQTSQKVEVRDFDIEDSFLEHRDSGYIAYVKLTLPKRELLRIEIKMNAFGVWAIETNVPQCENKIRELFPVLSSKLGVNINEQIEYSSKTPEQIFMKNKKMFYLKIECTETKAVEQWGEFYSIIELKAELFNLMTSKTINSWNVETKGAAYSAKEAQDNGISKAVQKIAEQIK